MTEAVREGVCDRGSMPQIQWKWYFSEVRVRAVSRSCECGSVSISAGKVDGMY